MAEEIKKIENPTSRLRAFSRRRNNLIKKANKLVKECGVEVAVVLISPSGHLYHFSSNHNMSSIVERYISLPFESRYADDPKLKEKQALLAQLYPIEGIGNKCLYLDLQAICLEKQVNGSKLERELTEATLRNFEVDAATNPSMEQLDWCEENLMGALNRLAEKKHELIMKELSMSSYDQSSSFFSNNKKMLDDMRKAQAERSASSILMQLDPWISPFSTKIRESILEEVKKEEKVANNNGGRSVLKNSTLLAENQTSATKSSISFMAQADQSNKFHLPHSSQVFDKDVNLMKDQRSKMIFDNIHHEKCKNIMTSDEQLLSAVLPNHKRNDADDQTNAASDSTQSLRKCDKEDEFQHADELVVPKETLAGMNHIL